MEKIIKDVEKKFPLDPSLQQVHLARRILAEEAKQVGMGLWDYITLLSKQRHLEQWVAN